jgi:mannose-1-phosphate guanylyltransferase/mannose-6-phosphate isomerase
MCRGYGWRMTPPTIVPVILSGGSGTRLWPLSRRTRPKQFAPLVGERTMLQDTALRLEGMEGVARPIVVCNEDHRDLVDRQLGAVGMPPSLVVMEPVGRNTAPAAAVAAMAATRDGSDPVLLVLPADHVIRDAAAFRAAVAAGARLAAQGYLVTFGIVPDRPHTGYGYVQRGEPLPDAEAFAVRRFVEKPDEETAAAYVADGEHSWNSGMFMFTASAYLAELSKHAPEMIGGSRAALEGASGAYGALLLAEEAFSATPADSIDYAVMERTDRAVVIPLDAGWSDVGAWPALWEIAERDDDDNALLGDVVVEGVTGSYVRAGGRLVTVVGLDDVVVVETPDAVLVAAREHAEGVKRIVELLIEQGRREAENHLER